MNDSSKQHDEATELRIAIGRVLERWQHERTETLCMLDEERAAARMTQLAGVPDVFSSDRRLREMARVDLLTLHIEQLKAAITPRPEAHLSIPRAEFEREMELVLGPEVQRATRQARTPRAERIAATERWIKQRAEIAAAAVQVQEHLSANAAEGAARVARSTRALDYVGGAVIVSRERSEQMNQAEHEDSGGGTSEEARKPSASFAAEVPRTDRQANYPIPRPEQDARFTIGLLIDVSRVLQKAGFPEASGFDLMELGQALIGFIYAAAPEAERATIERDGSTERTNAEQWASTHGAKHRCASPDCPGYPYRASDMAHPCGPQRIEGTG